MISRNTCCWLSVNGPAPIALFGPVVKIVVSDPWFFSCRVLSVILAMTPMLPTRASGVVITSSAWLAIHHAAEHALLWQNEMIFLLDVLWRASKTKFAVC